MACQVVAESDLCDICLLSKEEDRQQYMCGQCHNLAINTKALICTENHEQDVTFYCGSCATAIQSGNQCPINQHQNPKFADENTAQARIKRNLEFICPYSAQFNRHNAPIHAAIQDTMEGKQQHDQVSGCPWKGTYTQLQTHVMTCRFKPRESKSLVDLRKKVQALESDNTGLINKVRAMERTITTMKTVVQELTQLKHTVQQQPVNARLANSALVWILSVVVAILAAYIYTNNGDITRLKVGWIEMTGNLTSIRKEYHDYTSSNVVSTPHNRSMMSERFGDALHNMTLSMNVLNMSVIELRDNITSMSTSLNTLEGIINNQPVKILHAKGSSDTQSVEKNGIFTWENIMSWCTWLCVVNLINSVVKLILQLGCVLFILFLWTRQNILPFVGSVIFQFIVHFCFFYPPDNWIIDVVWVVSIGVCSWIGRIIWLDPKTWACRLVLAYIFVQSNILYWRFWYNDDMVLLIVAFCGTIILMYDWVTYPLSDLGAARGTLTHKLGMTVLTIAILTDVIVMY